MTPESKMVIEGLRCVLQNEQFTVDNQLVLIKVLKVLSGDTESCNEIIAIEIVTLHKLQQNLKSTETALSEIEDVLKDR